jgi:uncharacterized protein
VNPPPNGFVSNRVLKLNVGFLLSQSLGTSREFTFDVPPLAVSDDLRLSHLRGALRLSRTTEGILVQGKLETATEGECRRCLSQIQIPLTLELEELFALTPGAHMELTVGEDASIDLTPLLREEIIVNTPFAPLCKPTCAGLCPECGHNLNDGPCNCKLSDIDPRLAILMHLRDPD